MVQNDDGGCFLVVGIECANHRVMGVGVPLWLLGGWGVCSS